MMWTRVAACAVTLLVTGAAGTGCLSRPVGKQPPTTKVNFTSTISQQAVDKVDLLFAIDNSASMGDKQAILADAVPDLIQGLLNPACVNKNDGSATQNRADPAGNKDNNFGCPAGTEPEFKPVTDMHIGVISSSIGGLGGDVCPDTGRTNDRGLLLAGKLGGGEVGSAKPNNFLAWYPQSSENDDKKRHPDPANPIRTAAALTTDFTELVRGVAETGCGLEAQLEAMYRFLIQPDPWVKVRLDNNGQADLGEDIDFDVLKQRADFLRPDSLVAIIMLTDEDDSSADPLAVGGQGWAYMHRSFPSSNVVRVNNAGKTAPRGTKACDTDPGSADCTSCGFQLLCNPNEASCQKLRGDQNCRTSGAQGQSGAGYDGYYPPDDDDLNVRFQHMKQRYGIDPQYPLKRYIDGLTKPRVPDRKAEHVTTAGADGRRVIAPYTHTTKCTNPLFAAKLPTQGDAKSLCELQPGTRTSDLVFFAVVGGVPHQLLYPEGYSTTDPEKNRVTNDKWVKILGRDPERFNYDGIDPHMIQSVSPRPGLNGEASLGRGQNGSDPIHGRDWNTLKTDLQFACTFDLPTPRTCPPNDPQCDCQVANLDKNPPLCSSASGGAEQVKAKAYPTVREFQVVRALGDQGVAASLCPITLRDSDKDSPTEGPKYGYRPAVAAIIDRLKNALTTQCLPQKLKDDTASASADPEPVPCLVLAQLSDVGDSCSNHGLKEPAADILKTFREQQRAETGTVVEGGIDLAALPVCELPQRSLRKGETCEDATDLVFCYVENDPGTGRSPAGRCPQALLFSGGTATLAGARFSLQCIRQFAAGEAAGDTTQ